MCGRAFQRFQRLSARSRAALRAAEPMCREQAGLAPVDFPQAEPGPPEHHLAERVWGEQLRRAHQELEPRWDLGVPPGELPPQVAMQLRRAKWIPGLCGGRSPGSRRTSAPGAVSKAPRRRCRRGVGSCHPSGQFVMQAISLRWTTDG